MDKEKKYSFLVLSPSEWGDSAVSNMQVAAELSKKYDVIYIETPGRRLPRINEFFRVITKLKKFLFGSKKIQYRGLNPENVKIYSPLAFPIDNIFFRGINYLILTSQIKNIIKKNNFKNIILWSYSPLWYDVSKSIKKCYSVFHCVDGLHTYNNSKYFKEKYYKTVQSADIVFTPGTILYNELIELNNNTFRISHGVKKENFFKDKNTEPTEIDNIDQDIIVYSGTLANWVDYELLCYLCKMFPSKKFLF